MSRKRKDSLQPAVNQVGPPGVEQCQSPTLALLASIDRMYKAMDSAGTIPKWAKVSKWLRFKLWFWTHAANVAIFVVGKPSPEEAEMIRRTAFNKVLKRELRNPNSALHILDQLSELSQRNTTMLKEPHEDSADQCGG
jgi:hypothetical protein